MKGSAISRFWAKVNQLDDCWEWTGSKRGYGYGVIRINGRLEPAHRFSWRLHHGTIQGAMEVCHHCDRPACVNPAHLFLATHLENAKDAMAKGRFAVGERAPKAKLTAVQVGEILEKIVSGIAFQTIAKWYGVTYGTIYYIAHGRSWKHLNFKEEVNQHA